MRNISIVIPLAPNLKINPCKEINISKEIPVFIIKGKNPSKNRNEGFKKAKTKFIAFINGHTILSQGWERQVEKFFSEHPELDIVGGPQLNYEKDTFFAKTSGYALSSIFGAAAARARYKPGKLNLNAGETEITSANLICKREVFDKVKFDENLYPGEDPKFISDAKKAGFKIAYSPDIIVYNKRRENLKELAKQIFNYGRMRPKIGNLKETLKNPFFIIPSLFSIYLAVILALFLFSAKINWLFYAPLILYALISIFSSFFVSLKNNDMKSFFLLLLIYLTIHLSYGLGLIYGTIKNALY